MELLRTVRCLEYLPTDPPMPGIKLEAIEPVYDRTKEYVAPVDTGFAGYLMVPESDYVELATMELARDAFGIYSTLAGHVVMRRARINLKLGPVERESIVETPLHGGGKLLVGRRILGLTDLGLLGPSNRACGLERQSTRSKPASEALS